MNRFRVAAGCAVCLLAAAWMSITTERASSHCDTLDGPVVMDAREALAKGDVTPVLKWVRKEHEAEVRNAFESTLAVHRGGGPAASLADRQFFETVVRIHRQGEGAPYTGLSDEPVDPVVAMADEALSSGSPDDMLKKLNAHMESAVREKFVKVAETAKHKDQNVEAGRKYVEAYVTYMHYVESLHGAIVSSGVHGSEAEDGSSGRQK